MISIIVAKTEKNYIGKGNKLLFHISEDLKRFKKITTGHKIIMGRKTFESLPKLLENREHIVVTRDKNYKSKYEGVMIVNNIDEIIRQYEKSDEEVFVIGGGEIYKMMLPYCNKIYMTGIYSDIIGDTKFPDIDITEWWIDVDGNEYCENGIKFRFINLTRKTNL